MTGLRFVRFADVPAPSVAAPRYPFETTTHDRTPPGAVRIEGEVWLHNGELIVLGSPASEEDWPDPNTGHNCDEMGCTSVCHVVVRGRVTHGLPVDPVTTAWTGP